MNQYLRSELRDEGLKTFTAVVRLHLFLCLGKNSPDSSMKLANMISIRRLTLNTFLLKVLHLVIKS